MPLRPTKCSRPLRNTSFSFKTSTWDRIRWGLNWTAIDAVVHNDNGGWYRHRVAVRRRPSQHAAHASQLPTTFWSGGKDAGMLSLTVTAFGIADSHDEHYFQEPDQMVRD